jgi:hypothetical protein
MNPVPQAHADEKLIRLLKAAHLLDLEEAPREHSQRTPKCPSLPRFAVARTQGWTEAEKRHIFEEKCDYCQKVLAMFDRAGKDNPPADTQVATTSGGADTSVSLTALLISGDIDEFYRRLRLLAPGLLYSVGRSPGLTEDFLAWFKEHAPEMKGRHVRDALQIWLTKFARESKPEDAALFRPWTPENLVALDEAIATYNVLSAGAAGEPEWAAALRRQGIERRVLSAHQLRELPLPDEPAADTCLQDLCDEIDRAKRDVAAVMHLTV